MHRQTMSPCNSHFSCKEASNEWLGEERKCKNKWLGQCSLTSFCSSIIFSNILILASPWSFPSAQGVQHRSWVKSFNGFNTKSCCFLAVQGGKLWISTMRLFRQLCLAKGLPNGFCCAPVQWNWASRIWGLSLQGIKRDLILSSEEQLKEYAVRDPRLLLSMMSTEQEKAGRELCLHRAERGSGLCTPPAAPHTLPDPSAPLDPSWYHGLGHSWTLSGDIFVGTTCSSVTVLPAPECSLMLKLNCFWWPHAMQVFRIISLAPLDQLPQNG